MVRCALLLMTMLLTVVCIRTYAHDGKRLVLQPLELHNTEGQKVKLNQSKAAIATVYVLLGPECPISQQCTGELNALAKRYSNNGVQFYGVFPGTYYTKAEINTFSKSYGVHFPLLQDTAYLLTKMLKGNITPEVFVVDKNHEVLYSGAIDNSYRELGRKNPRTTAHYLAAALQAIIDGQPIAITSVKAIGCLVEYKNDKVND